MHAALLTALLFAMTGVCAAQASRLLGAARANAWRLLVALAILAVWAHGFGPGVELVGGSWFFAAGAIGFGCGGWCVFQALRRVGSTLTLLVVECAATVFAVAIGWLWLGAALRPIECLAIAAILGGILFGARPGPVPALPPRVIAAGVALAAFGALFQAISFNLSRQGFMIAAAAEAPAHPMAAAYLRLIGGAAMALVLFVVTLSLPRGRRTAGPGYGTQHGYIAPRLPAPVWVGLNALFGPVLGVTCMLWAISMVENPGLVQAIAATSTLLTIPLARRLEGAKPRAPYYAGAILALAGVAALLLV